MSKAQRHEQRKVERARRRRGLFRNPLASPLRGSAIRNQGAAALAAAAAIAAGTAAYAAPVRFDNPAHGDGGHFHWPSADPSGVLDITLPSASQPGVGGGYYYSEFRQGNPGAEGFVLSAPYTAGALQGNAPYYGLLVGVSAGETIPTAGLYLATGSVSILYTYPGGPPYSLLPEGVPTYLGTRFGPYGGQYYGTAQYGWIGGVRTGNEFEAFAWGYETEVGVPIEAGVPEPGSLALLAFGACAALRRRRA